MPILPFFFERCMTMYDDRYAARRKQDAKSRTIQRQAAQIKDLKREIERLETLCREQEETISSTARMHDEMASLVSELKGKVKEYDSHIDEIKKMKAIFNKDLFKGRWNLVKFLVK